MSGFLPDEYWKGKDKPKHDNRPRNFVTGAPIEEIPVRPERRQPKGKPIPADYMQTAKDLYHIGKAIHKSVKSQRGGNTYLHQPRDFDATIEKAKQIKKMEKKATQYHKAKGEIEDYETRRQEYEARNPSKSIFRRMFGG